MYNHIFKSSLILCGGIGIVFYSNQKNKDLQFTRKELLKYNGIDHKNIFVTYKGLVYDITDFVKGHPGGDRIKLAYGKDLEPWWNLYPVHTKEKYVLDILDSYKIGRLYNKEKDIKFEALDPYLSYKNEPERIDDMIVHSLHPYNAEPLLKILANNYYTPNKYFFVRNHMPVPKIDIEDYRLIIDFDITKLSLSFKDLLNYPKTYMIVAFHCAGNRRKEMENVEGTKWQECAIGNAKWVGVALKDIIDTENAKNFKHIHFIGTDYDEFGKHYSISVPSEKINDILLAYEMNEEKLSPDHGYPLRVIVAGNIGTRNVKWLSSISFSNIENDSFWQQKDYKILPPNIINWKTVNLSDIPAIQEGPVTSGILFPENDNTIYSTEKEKTITVMGYAWSGGGKGISRVDFSEDNGKSWTQAKLIKQDNENKYKNWGWTRWEKELVIAPHSNTTKTIVCKAVDVANNTQPQTYHSIWNMRGILNNSWHKINIKIKMK